MKVSFAILHLFLTFLLKYEINFKFLVLEQALIIAREYSWIIYLILPIILFFWICTLYQIKKEYNDFKKRTRITAIKMVLNYHLYSLIIIYSSWCNLWCITLDFYLSNAFFIMGSIVGSVFGLFYLKVEIQFHSIKSLIGLEVKSLSTEGVFKRTRNPHSISRGFAQIGVAIMGKSIFAISLGLIWWILNHFNILQEEKLLTDLFGKEFLEYCEKTPRYFSFFKKICND